MSLFCKTLFLSVSIYNIQTTLKKQQMYGYAKDVNGVSSPVLLNNIRNITYSGSSIYVEYIGASGQADGNVNIILSSPVSTLQQMVEKWIRDNTTGSGGSTLLNDYIGNVKVNGVFNAGPSIQLVQYEAVADLAAACAASPTTNGTLNQNSAFPTPIIGQIIYQTDLASEPLLPLADGNYSIATSAGKFFVTIANSLISYVEICPIEIQKVFAPNEWDNRTNGMMSYTGCFLNSMSGSSATSQWFNSLGAQPWIGLADIPEVSNMSGPIGCDRVFLQGIDGMSMSAASVYYSNAGATGPWYLWGSWNSGNPYPLGVTSGFNTPVGNAMSGTFSLPAFQHTAGGIDYTFPKNAFNSSTYFCGGTSNMYIEQSGSNQGQIVMKSTSSGCGVNSPSNCTFPCP